MTDIATSCVACVALAAMLSRTRCDTDSEEMKKRSSSQSPPKVSRIACRNACCRGQTMGTKQLTLGNCMGPVSSYAFPKRFVDVQHFVIPAPHLFINNGTQAFLSRFATTTLKQWNTLEQSPQSRSEGHILASCCFLHVIFGYIYIYIMKNICFTT